MDPSASFPPSATNNFLSTPPSAPRCIPTPSPPQHSLINHLISRDRSRSRDRQPANTTRHHHTIPISAQEPASHFQTSHRPAATAVTFTNPYGQQQRHLPTRRPPCLQHPGLRHHRVSPQVIHTRPYVSQPFWFTPCLKPIKKFSHAGSARLFPFRFLFHASGH